jgi:hypothetical protein
MRPMYIPKTNQTLSASKGVAVLLVRKACNSQRMCMALDGDSKQECSRSGFDRYSQANQCSVLYYIGEDIRYTSRWRAKCKLWRQDAAPRRLMNVLVARIKKKIWISSPVGKTGIYYTMHQNTDSLATTDSSRR